MALEKLQQAKALIGFLARGVREAIRPHEDLGYAPSPPSSPGLVPAPAGVAEAAAIERTPLVTPPPEDGALLESARADLLDPDFSGVRLRVGPSHVAIAWRTSAARLAAARQIAEGPLALRMVAVRQKGELDVEVQTMALGPAENEGARLVTRPDALLRAVASVGLDDGARFVSIAHADAA